MSADLAASPFVDALARGEIVYQRCDACGASQRLARSACCTCGSDRLRWLPANGAGTVFAVTVVSRAPAPEFAALVPYALALVDLDEGARLMGHAPAGLRVGERVVTEVFSAGGRPLVRFKPLPSLPSRPSVR